VLIVEDELFTREIAMMLAEDWGYHPLSASDVSEALAIIRSPQQISVLFTDIYLKDDVNGGCDLAREARRLRPSLRVLYTTGNAASNTLKEQFVAGAHFIPKPYSPDQLKFALENLIAH
jgi:CheY-like chemotaxis protein